MVTILRDNAVIVRVNDRIIHNLDITRKAQPNAIQTATYGIVSECIALTKHQFDRIVHCSLNDVTRDQIITCTRRGLEKDAIAIFPSYQVILDAVVA